MGPSPIFTSAPARAPRFLPSSKGSAGCGRPVKVALPAEYGSTSRRRVGLMPSMPTSSPIHDDQPVRFVGTGTQNTSSLVAGFQWSALKPQTCTGASLKRSCENGMRISVVQPRESTTAFASQTGSKPGSRLYSLSCGWYQSIRTPDAVTPNEYAVRRSW